MLGLFNTLNLGSRSLAAQQLGAEVTGQNLANVDNTAYARQRVVLQTSTPLQTGIGQEGTGVVAVAIQQIRDALLDGQIQTQGSVSGSLSAQQKALQDAEVALGEQVSSTSTSGNSSSPNGLLQKLTDFFNSLQSLSSDPSSLTQRQAVIAAAQDLATQFNQVDSQLSAMHVNLSTAVQTDVTSANQDLSDIATLNQQIIASQMRGGTANDLIDLREQKLEDLSSKVQFTATTQADGGVDITIGGVTMVSGVSQPDSLEAYDAGGGRLLVRAQTAGTDLTLTGGSIEGEITARDGAVANLQLRLNGYAQQLMAEVNNIYTTGYDLNGNGGQPFFNGGSSSDMAVNPGLVNDPSTFQASGTSGAAGDNSIVLALAQLANQGINGQLQGQTFTAGYSRIVAGLGQTISSINDQVASSNAVTSMLSNQRASVSGVSLDEEMTNLMQFQKAYQASAQLISTINEMLQTVIAMKGS